MPDSEETLGVVIVTYKTRELLRECIASVLQEARDIDLKVHLVVVDNASGDGTCEMVRSLFPEVTLIANTENLGPARAYNQGVQECLRKGGSFILLLNSDVRLLPGSLRNMLAYLSSHPEVDGVTGLLRNPDMTPQKTRTSL